ncbi:hypothetical protein M2336_001646 [Sphingobium sp. B1D7B]|uniref:hypothetical protein n=1 Tax=Sphingobium sp. B1D7B TaxID=2940578 RepID=UPI00222559B0|nr:hypothetical protein [Sphingobium sp. B1D7B]MCW2405017.1 hypothetical protein [Sphingobium sp. B1D7B]
MTTPAEIARKLSEAQKRALVECTPWDVEVGAGIAAAFVVNGLLEDSTIIDDGVQLSRLGLAVRAILEEQKDA